MFSKSCEYALQSVIYIAMHSKEGNSVGLKIISDQQEIPSHFLSKILQKLVKSDILISTKGPNGGFSLCWDAKELRLIDIVEIIDGNKIFDRCGIGLKECSDSDPCPIHFEFKLVKNHIRSLFSDKSVSDLIQDIETGKSILNYH
jgi:Rrf2 family protein